MANTLTELWRQNPAFFDGKSFRQIIQMAGDGILRDGNQASLQVREWLGTVPLYRLRSSAEECLSGNFQDSDKALQDAVNEIGSRLGFRVTQGRYRGVRNVIGNDGLWVGQDEFGLLVEVKTSDAFRINLDTIAEYRYSLIKDGTIREGNSSILIAVGRQDTGDLEAQIRGSRHAWDVRLISIDALLRLAEVKEQLNDWSTSDKINQLLRPVEYTRLDGIVDLLFATKMDLESGEPTFEPTRSNTDVTPTVANLPNLEAAREAAIQRAEQKLQLSLVRRGKTQRISSDGTTRVVCLASQKYKGTGESSNYWFGVTPVQLEFLKDAPAGFVVLACGTSGGVFLIPREHFLEWLPALGTTAADSESTDKVRHWHVYLTDHGDHIDLMRYGGGILSNLAKYQLAS